jgi:MFS superfamily sulfate permease-like transporter
VQIAIHGAAVVVVAASMAMTGFTCDVHGGHHCCVMVGYLRAGNLVAFRPEAVINGFRPD